LREVGRVIDVFIVVGLRIWIFAGGMRRERCKYR